jgi:HK97 family phage major capsid protein
MAGVKSQLVEKRGELDTKSKMLKQVFDEAGPDLDMDKVKSLEGDSTAKVEKIREMHTEIGELQKAVDGFVAAIHAQEGMDAQAEARELAGKMQHSEGQGTPKIKSMGQFFAESQQYKDAKDKKDLSIQYDVELKTLMTTSAGWAPETTRGPRMIDFVTRPIQVVDTVPTTTTSQTAIKYMQETTFTNNAAEVAEGGTKPEAALALTEVTDPVRKIAVWIPVTEEQLEDVPGVQSYIDNRLTFMVRQRLDSQILVGDGTAPNLSGILDRAGIQSQAKGADPTPDAFYKAMMLVRLTGAGNGGAIPNAIYMNPLDWQDIRLLRTTDGIYIWGSPADPGVDRLWGLPVVLAEGLTAGTGLVGDTSYLELAVKKGITLKTTDSHSDYFIKNQLVILAEMRAALVVYRPAAWVQVTGI